MIKRRAKWLLVILLSILVTACFIIRERGLYTFIKSGNVERINPCMARRLVNDSDLYIIDARSEAEYQLSHIEGANLFQDQLMEKIEINQPILVYCTIGIRSNSLAKDLHDLGFEKIYDLKGGLINWVNQKNELVNSTHHQTDSIHTYYQWLSLLLSHGTAVYQ